MNKMFTAIAVIALLVSGILFYFSINNKAGTGPEQGRDNDEEVWIEPEPYDEASASVPETITEGPDTDMLIPLDEGDGTETSDTGGSTSMANPASEYCENNGGTVEIVTDTDGSQFGLCYLDENTACEEWAYMRGECDFEGDAELIKEALIAKGLDLSDSKVVITKHLGDNIEGSVTPISQPVGGGYVFAVKQDGVISIVADGNGSMLCSYFDDYPDFSSYLVPECYEEVSGQNIKR